MSQAFVFSGGLLFPCFHILIMRKFMDIFFRHKLENPIRYAAWAAYYVLLVAAQMEIGYPSLPLLLFNVFLVFMTATFSYNASLKNRCIFSGLLIAVWMLAEVIVVIVLLLLGMDGWGLKAAGTAITNICMYVVAVIAGHCAKGEERPDLSVQYVIAVILIPAGTIYLMHHIFLIVVENAEYSAFAIFSSFFLLLMNYTAFEVYERMRKDASAQERSLLYEQELELINRQTEQREAYDKQICRIRHDMKNHMTGLLGILQEGSREAAEEYIRFLLKEGAESQVQEISHSGNSVVDAIVNDKYRLAQKEGVKFTADVFLPSDIPFCAGHLAIVFGNLLDNALEACGELEKGERWIKLKASYEKKILMVVVHNSCKERKKGKNGRFFTTKERKYAHGIGLSSVEQAAASYEGQLETEYRDGSFCSVVVMYGNEEKNHQEKK